MIGWLRIIIAWVRNLFKRAMRRKRSLYIADRLVDLDDQSFILFNYTMEDLTNPTIVKNSFSQQITLKGTPNNNRIFGDIFRLDRVVGNNGGSTGTDFNPARKTPFTIYNEMSEILESGYVKLDSVTRNRSDVEYKVTLYGGLGSFLYSLAYNEEGGKRTLADLDYLGTGNSETELDFTINAANVRAAWDTDTDEGEVDELWKVINFAPAYNGIPEGNFSADKAIVKPSDIGLLDTIDGHTLRSGYALVNLAQAYDEWAVKDLRSYLQRPVLSMRAFLHAITIPNQNGGYEVDLKFLEDEYFDIYHNLWLTLPLIPSLGTSRKTSGDLSLEMSAVSTTSTEVARYDIDGEVPFGTDIATNLFVSINMNVPTSEDDWLLRSILQEDTKRQTMYVLQAVAYGADDTIVGCSRVRLVADLGLSVKTICETYLHYEPVTIGIEDEVYDPDMVGEVYFSRNVGKFTLDSEVGLVVNAQDVAYYKVFMTAYEVTSVNDNIISVSGGTSPLGKMYDGDDTEYTPTSALMTPGVTDDSISYTSSETLRSGAVITKRMLLSTSKTPADYLLSFCKILGLSLECDKAQKKITILSRNQMYTDETIDLSRRVDLSHPVDITPFVYDTKYYQFGLEGVGGAFADEYLQTQGLEYGIQRVNTGYDFNADVNGLLEGNAFKNAVTILDHSKYYTSIVQGGKLKPSVLVDPGHTYTLWNAAGENLDTNIPMPTNAATISYLNEDGHDGYDVELARKMEFRSNDNKPVDGSDVLLFWEGMNNYPYFNLTDDVPAMDVLNEGVPCWILTPGDDDPGLSVPVFQRYKYRNDWTIQHSLDFGVPRELDIPAITYPQEATLYYRMWKKYLTDRFSVNTKVLHCRVNLMGLQVTQELFRKFYWYDNSLWVLNKIKNYSLTTFDPVECEFIQVQDKDNYLNGQTY